MIVNLRALTFLLLQINIALRGTKYTRNQESLLLVLYDLWYTTQDGMLNARFIV